MNDSMPYSCGKGLFTAERPISQILSKRVFISLINGWRERGRHAARSPTVKCVSCRHQSKRVALAVRIKNVLARRDRPGCLKVTDFFFFLFVSWVLKLARSAVLCYCVHSEGNETMSHQ